MLTGSNSILNKFTEAREKTLISQQKEQSLLNNYEEQISSYTGIDWENAKKNAKAPEEQKEERNNGVIGIGTDGKAVNMDLWLYSKLEDNTFVLNESASSSKNGYVGDFSEDGKIYGKIPQYISIDNGKNYEKVTSLYSTFKKCTQLKVAPEIPETIKEMFCAFSQTGVTKAPIIPKNVENLAYCFEVTPILEMPDIPDGVENLTGTFSRCSKLVKITKIPSSVKTLRCLFANCENISDVPEYFSIPNGVTNIQQLFYNCKNLKNIKDNFVIPSSVDDVRQTFSGCVNLQGEILMDTTPSYFINCFQSTSTETANKLRVNYKSKCKNIEEILANSSKSNAEKGIYSLENSVGDNFSYSYQTTI